MRKTLSFLLFIITLAGSINAQAARTKTAEVRPQAAEYAIPFVTKTLANGLEVIVYPDSSVPLVTVELAVRNGSFTEPPEFNGLSHLYEHMFFKPNKAIAIYRCDLSQKFGNEAYFSQQNCAETLKLRSQVGDVAYLSDLDKTGIVRNGSTQEEYVNYYYTATSKHFETLLHALRDSMLYPVFDENEFRQEIQVVLGEIDRQESQPGYHMQTAMMDALFYKYPSRKRPGGTRETVATATTDKMRTIQARYYVPNNSALVITGDVKPNDAFALAERLFGVWKKGDDPFVKYPLVEHPPLPKSVSKFVMQDVDNVFIQLGWQGPSIGKDNASTYAADVFSGIVGQPDSKFQRALVDAGLAVSVDVHYYTQRNVGPIRITLVTTPAKAKEAVAALYRETPALPTPHIIRTRNSPTQRPHSKAATSSIVKRSATTRTTFRSGGPRRARIITATITSICGRRVVQMLTATSRRILPASRTSASRCFRMRA
ncbi:MAG: putative Zn-dependent peptidase [Acidobacteria bacterium OLB17]|nr:MAG: putative Zn-dependent peptidase [Acidobacteria bacterium OLB17]